MILSLTILRSTSSSTAKFPEGTPSTEAFSAQLDCLAGHVRDRHDAGMHARRSRGPRPANRPPTQSAIPHGRPRLSPIWSAAASARAQIPERQWTNLYIRQLNPREAAAPRTCTAQQGARLRPRLRARAPIVLTNKPARPAKQCLMRLTPASSGRKRVVTRRLFGQHPPRRLDFSHDVVKSAHDARFG